jgi:hypothetical protein
VIAVPPKFGDTWKMLKWTISGKMGGIVNSKSGNGHSAPPPAPKQENELHSV